MSVSVSYPFILIFWMHVLSWYIINNLIKQCDMGGWQDYAKTDGLEYICPHCSVTNHKKKSQKIANGLGNVTAISRHL